MVLWFYSAVTVDHIQTSIAREPFGSFALKFAKTLATGFLPGLVSGFFAFGLGSRVAMRVMAATSGPEVQGAKTEADAIVGKITFEGTMFLILAGTVIGGVAGLVYLAIKPWLPEERWKRNTIFSVVMLALVGRALVDSNNIDFFILSPAALAVSMFVAMPLLYGWIFVVLHDRLTPLIMHKRGRWTTAFLLAPCLLPLAAGGVLSLVIVPLLLLVGWALSGSPSIAANKTMLLLGRAVLVALVAVGITFVGTSAAAIL